jgi:hypothetical protein
VQAANKSIYGIDFNTLNVISWPKRLTQRKLLVEMWESIKEKVKERLGWKIIVPRDTCTSNTADEPAGVDFFG